MVSRAGARLSHDGGGKVALACIGGSPGLNNNNNNNFFAFIPGGGAGAGEGKESGHNSNQS